MYNGDADKKIRDLRRSLPEADFKKALEAWKKDLLRQQKQYKADAEYWKQHDNNDISEGQAAAARMIQKKIDQINRALHYEDPAKQIQKKKQQQKRTVRRKQKRSPVKVQKNNKAAAVFSMLAAETKGEKK